MIVAELPHKDLSQLLTGPGLRLRTGPVVTCVQSRLQAVAEGLALHYAEHAVEPDQGFADFHVRIARPRGLRRWLQPQVLFHFDGAPPFYPLPADQAFPMLEWGLNWCISAHCHQYLVLHSAVVERSGRALMLPAPPGSGKSTLCAGLVNRGWRLLSDELALIDPVTGEIVPLPRPVSLKNASIDVIRRFSSDATIGPTVHDTLKGSVAHMKPPVESVRRSAERASPGWLVLPRYEANASLRVEPLGRGRAFMHLVDSGFNYHLHGRGGFEVLAQLTESSVCYDLTYSDLAQAVEACDELAESA